MYRFCAKNICIASEGNEANAKTRSLCDSNSAGRGDEATTQKVGGAQMMWVVSGAAATQTEKGENRGRVEKIAVCAALMQTIVVF